MDVLTEMLDELRTQQPKIYLTDAYATWLRQIGVAIAALPTQQQRWAATVLCGDDLATAMPGMPLSLAYHTILEAVLKAGRP